MDGMARTAGPPPEYSGGACGENIDGGGIDGDDDYDDDDDDGGDGDDGECTDGSDSGGGGGTGSDSDEQICDKCGAPAGHPVYGGVRCRCWITLDDASVISLDAPVWRPAAAPRVLVDRDGIIRVVLAGPGGRSGRP